MIRLAGVVLTFVALWGFPLVLEHPEFFRGLPLMLGFPLAALSLLGCITGAVIGLAITIGGADEDEKEHGTNAPD